MFSFGIGLLLGTLGTLIGVGGGFLLVPLLFHLHSEMSPSQITAMSLFCVTLSAISGSSQYAFRKQIHFKTGVLFALVALPGTWLGVNLVYFIARQKFELVYAVLLTFIGIYLLIKKQKARAVTNASEIVVSKKDLLKGATASFAIGSIASFSGVGGGILHVPFLNQVLRFPVHIATGTSQFILAITSLAAVMQHYFKGSLSLSQSFIAHLAIGMVLGAQIGGRLSRGVNGTVILRLLGLVILAVAGRIFYAKFNF